MVLSLRGRSGRSLVGAVVGYLVDARWTIRAAEPPICDALPESFCESAKRHATFRVRKKPYAYFHDNHDRDGVVAALWKTSLAEQAALVARDPKRYYVPPYIGPRGWIAQRVDRGRVDWKDLAVRIAASHALVAPKLAARGRS